MPDGETIPTSPAEPGLPAPTPGDHGGTEYDTGAITGFGRSLEMAGKSVALLGPSTPVFEGSDKFPFAGIPVVGLFFVHRFNEIAETWADCAGLLEGVLGKECEKFFQVAKNYSTTEEELKAAAERLRH
ncbi:hypothetical protein [Nonomuraea sp. bgisy101]|uniref:hypothetical protein n=1 Tax=Nonomuraea sp. bgisy101 TaxID=3413784 RepID=UPI003D71DEDD